MSSPSEEETDETWNAAKFAAEDQLRPMAARVFILHINALLIGDLATSRVQKFERAALGQLDFKEARESGWLDKACTKSKFHPIYQSWRSVGDKIQMFYDKYHEMSRKCLVDLKTLLELSGILEEVLEEEVWSLLSDSLLGSKFACALPKKDKFGTDRFIGSRQSVWGLPGSDSKILRVGTWMHCSMKGLIEQLEKHIE